MKQKKNQKNNLLTGTKLARRSAALRANLKKRKVQKAAWHQKEIKVDASGEQFLIVDQ